MILIGFTGSREGLTPAQHDALHATLIEFQSHAGCELHHGDCVGADAAAAGLARILGYRIVSHPPTDPSRRAFVASDEERAPLPHLDRNRAIVDGCAVLVAVPKDFAEQHRSGTWATIRYARKVGRRTMILRPNGVVDRWERTE